MKALINLQLMMFSLIVVGLLLKKKGIVGAGGQKNMTDLVIDVILPCNIIKSFMVDFSIDIMKSFAGIFIISVLIQILCVFLGKVLYNKTKESRRKCLRYATICSNAGFMGNPVAEGVFGSMGLMLASIYLIPLRIMMWSEGIAIFTDAPDKKALVKKVATHPCIIACAIGIVLMLTGWRPPVFVTDVIGSLSGCNTAVSMMVIGMILADADPRTIFDKEILLYTLTRLGMIPLIVWVPCQLLHVDALVTGVSVILAAMPAGATTSILASKYNGDAEFAVKLVVFSTAASLISTPIWGMLLVS